MVLAIELCDPAMMLRSLKHRSVNAMLAVAILGAAAAAAMAAEPHGPRIGQVKTVSGEAVVVRDGERLAPKVGDPIYQSDAIETGDGTIGVTLIDNSVFSTGPGTRLALPEFHFVPTSKTNSMLAELRKGTLTIVTGDLPHSGPEAMKIKTPTSILGVRGTTFAIEVR